MAVHRIRVDENGRVVIPDEVRKRLGVEPGEDVVLDVGPHDVMLSSHPATLAALKQLVHGGVRPPYSVAAFLKGRRRAAAEETGIWRRRRKRGG